MQRRRQLTACPITRQPCFCAGEAWCELEALAVNAPIEAEEDMAPSNKGDYPASPNTSQMRP